MDKFDKISQVLVNERAEFILEKAYCTVVFTNNYVIKLFSRNKKEYDINAIMHEYLWDSKIPLLNTKLVENVLLGNVKVQAMILRRLPKSSNMLYKLASGNISDDEVLLFAEAIEKLVAELPSAEINSDELYRYYVSNLKLQIAKLHNKITPDLYVALKKLLEEKKLLDLFGDVRRKWTPALVHGNLFSGNIFYFKGEVIVLDPISYNHIARKSYRQMDLATFLVDIRLFGNDHVFYQLMRKFTKNMNEDEVILLTLYFLLKLLVRLRFAYMEEHLKDDYLLLNVNKIIIEKTEEIVKKELQTVLRNLF